MLWAAWFAEYGVLYTYQLFFSHILAAEGRSHCEVFRIIGGDLFLRHPGYVMGGYVVDGSTANTQFLFHLCNRRVLEHFLTFAVK